MSTTTDAQGAKCTYEATEHAWCFCLRPDCKYVPAKVVPEVVAEVGFLELPSAILEAGSCSVLAACHLPANYQSA